MTLTLVHKPSPTERAEAKCAMAREEGNSSERTVERRSPPTTWQDPKTWMQLISLLLLVGSLVGGFLAAQLSQINANLVVMREDRATKTEQIAQIRRDLDKLEAKQAKDQSTQNDYNYDQMKTATQIKTSLGMIEKEKK